jgi:hypothetical protein
MKRETYSEEYETVRISYPSEWNFACPSCGEKVKFKYPDDGKLVHTLKGPIYQVVNLYSCTSSECEFHEVAFNPCPRFDYSQRTYGADVFRYIAEEFLVYELKPNQIFKRLTKKYRLKISKDTVRRICDDILKLKSLKIDEKTLEIVKKQGNILLGFDGQDPGGDAPSIWCFMDLISNRVLATYKFDALDYKLLHQTIEKVQKFYGIKIIGWVSDKQNLITKCHDTFYPEIPHQYCQYHFLRNTWNHLEALDSNTFLTLKKAVNSLYIHTKSNSALVFFEGLGKKSVREVFKGIDMDLQKMIKGRNKTFKDLRGIRLFEELTEYQIKMEEILSDKDPALRFTKILTKTSIALKSALNDVNPYYEASQELNQHFQQIRDGFGNENMPQKERIDKLAKIYEDIFSKVCVDNPELDLTECKSFLPNKKKSKMEIMVEWCRLWESYLPGLFQYYNFPLKIKTNNSLEQGFSTQKQALFNRVAKANIIHMIATRGEDYLRIKHCDPEELESDIVKEYTEEVINELRAQLRADIKERTDTWSIRRNGYLRLEIVAEDYYQNLKKKKGGRNFVG